jgi:translation initiation factor IF-1
MQNIFRLGILGLGLALLALTACTTAPAAGDGQTIRWQGTVEAVLPDGLQVSGQRVRWTGDTQILGSVQVGSQVEIEGTQADGALSAMVIRVRSSAEATAMGPGAAGTFVSPLPTPIPRMEFRGVVEEILPNGYRVAGQTVIVTTTTRVEGAVEVGVFVKVKGILQADGSVLALQIEVEAPPAEVEFKGKGVVEAILPDGYQIAGRTVVVTATTRIDGPIAVGTFVEVKGTLQPDGTILASRIHVEKPERKGAEIEFKGVVEEILPNGYRVSGRTVVVTATTRIDGPIAVGDLVEVKGVLQADGTILASRIHVEKPERKGAEIEFKGVVEEVLPNGYRVSGRTVVVTATTRIDGPIAVGDLVEVKGVLQADGTVLASRIHREDRSGKDSGSLQAGRDEGKKGGDPSGKDRKGSGEERKGEKSGKGDKGKGEDKQEDRSGKDKDDDD